MIDGAADANDFYERAFSATVATGRYRTAMPDGKIGHEEMAEAMRGASG